MSSTSTNLVLPYLAAGQAQKHVTVNESLRKLDAVVQLSVVSATTTAEPGSPGDGDVYIVPSGKTGTHWAGFTNWALAYYRDGAWEQITPREGWRAWVRDADALQVYDGSAWLQGVRSNRNAAASPGLVAFNFEAVGPNAGDAVNITYSFGGAVRFYGARANGTLASKSAIASGDPLMSFGALGYGASAYGGTRAQLSAKASETWTNSAQGAELVLEVAANGGTTLSTALVLRNDRSLNHYGNIVPGSDNALSFGTASFRSSVVYSATGAISTSDAREKTALRPLSAAETRAVRKVMAGVGVFQWLASLAAKGEDARLHAGVTAQAVLAAFEAEGLDPSRYGLFCADPLVETAEVEPAREVEVVDEATEKAVKVLTPARTETRPVLDAQKQQVVRLGVRYDQLFAMALAVLFQPPQEIDG